jgi:hypothetical protein
VDREPRRFGDDEEIAGFEEDLQGRHRQKFAQAFAFGEENASADGKPFFGVDGVLRTANLPLAQELAEITHRGEWDAALQKYQKGEMLLPFLDGEGKGYRRRFVHFGSPERR